MPYTTAAKNRMLDALARGVAPAAGITHVSLHSGNPGNTGANELAGGAPAYARKAINWNAAAGGSIDDSSNGISFDIPAGSTVQYVGYWENGNFLASSDAADETYNQQGIYTLTDADLDLNAV